MNFITANSCADTFVLDPDGTGTTTIMNFSAARGDIIELASAGSPTATNSPGGPGVLAMTNSVDIAMVADNAALLAETLPNGGAGGFAYEQDSGGLYYNSAGNFSGGGTLIGTITGNGSTPWTYDASRFIQV